MNTHDADRPKPAAATTAAAASPSSDEVVAFVDVLAHGDRDGCRQIFDAALAREPSFSISAHSASLLRVLRGIRERYPRLPILVGGQALRGTDTNAWSDLHDILGVVSLDELDAYVTQIDRSGFGPGSELRVTSTIAPDPH